MKVLRNDEASPFAETSCSHLPTIDISGTNGWRY